MTKALPKTLCVASAYVALALVSPALAQDSGSTVSDAMDASGEAKAKSVAPAENDAIVARASRDDATKAETDKVQLWEDGPYWATTNIGAEKPWESGLYFWWGDTVGYRRENGAWVSSDGSIRDFSFSEENTQTIEKDKATLQSEGWITSAGVLAPEHDAAHVHWGGNWRMATEQELSDLKGKCDWTWITMHGVSGYVIRGRGDFALNCIFLPAAGYGDGTSLRNVGSYGYSWSSVPGSYYKYSWSLYFHSSDYDTRNYERREGGLHIRPVQGFDK